MLGIAIQFSGESIACTGDTGKSEKNTLSPWLGKDLFTWRPPSSLFPQVAQSSNIALLLLGWFVCTYVRRPPRSFFISFELEEG